MSLDSQHRVCRAGIVIGTLLCIAALFEVAIGVSGMLRDFGGTEAAALEDPKMAGRVAGEFLITVIVRMWPLPLGVLVLTPSLFWYGRLRRKTRGLS